MKDEYSLLNNVEIDFSQYVIEEVNELEKKKLMRQFTKSRRKTLFWNKRKAIIAIIALFLIINLGIHGDKVLAGAASFKDSINKWLGINTNGENYSTEIEKTLEGKDIKLTLNEFFTDNSRIIINFNINKKKNDLVDINHKVVPDIYINGKKIERSSDYVGYSISGYKDFVGYDKAENNEFEKETNVILEVEMKELPLTEKEDVKLVFSSLAEEYGVNSSDFTYTFVYDATSYKNDTKVVKVDENITIGDNELSLDNVTITPDKVLISGDSKGFSAHENNKDANYHYDIVDANDDSVPLRAEIGNGAYFYRNYVHELPEKHFNINSIKIIPYTFNKINTNTTSVSNDGRIKYIIEDKIVTINLK
ncbi:DUF4179 domain-containing protein [Clostridium beijerinckii]|jgi:acetyltransferase-like isoleucine patch superfamily enzyme|uniref:DUF4179 domain-containing protein n=2 Tax=Clostridium beijerinckii TaxID=1520 RepID=A0AAW3WBG2_CLOBE|nr:DUF4179 domain-containing protein [Clostridium beijerinckii]MBC2458895.1 DUF4179 domain-containing protein [Clostridium beijerinckii]MBC2476320.1 DUF4179 domain-containing protein [Clostridium beijerinckii]MCI1578197.1 DUF4179 domain-containing protein [Clostridium beijerinckii]MCI1584622.1 DUF4179 domain-containing protein [Clostridium beijerinckii]MCI1620954.1 DUF4179 domain-containing protein [Clostridium beijerinckii]